MPARASEQFDPAGDGPFEVLIVGGSVAGLEAALALQDLAAERVRSTLLTPAPEFVYRPMVVREPFGYSTARRYPLDEIARDLEAELVADRLKWVEPGSRVVHTEGGLSLTYDALVLAMGARTRPRFRHAITLDDRELDGQLHGLIQDVEGGYVRSLAFLIPDPMPWPLPIYELALMTAGRATDSGMELTITILTPEEAPLALFGGAVSQALADLLAQNGISVLTSSHPEVWARGRVAIHPGDRTLEADRILALPQLFGPATPGIPKGAPDGFLSVDAHCAVRGVDRIFAAGDATAFPVKFGGIAAQQADAAAQAIAALAGAPIDPRPFVPVIHGVLLGGPKPLYLSAHITGGHGSSSAISDDPGGAHRAKIEARYLAPYLEERDRRAEVPA
jgi:sulfide:quinone oxidoreductase